MSHDIITDLVTLRDYWRYAISRFNAAELSYGHGTQSAVDAIARDVIGRLQDSGIDPSRTGATPGLLTDGGVLFTSGNAVGLAGRIALNPLANPDKGGDGTAGDGETRVAQGRDAVAVGDRQPLGVKPRLVLGGLMRCGGRQSIEGGRVHSVRPSAMVSEVTRSRSRYVGTGPPTSDKLST